MHFPGPGPIGHGIGLIFGAIIWAVGSLIMLAIIVALLVLLVRYLWFGTKASQRYLEINGQPVRHVRPAAAPATAAPATTVEPAAAATTPPPTKPAPRPRTPRTPPTA